MRLIDADMVKQYILTEGFYCDTKADKEDTAEEIDQLFSTVDAIPVAFIEEKMRRYEVLAYQSTPKIQQRYFDKVDALKSLIYYWHEKNEKGDDDATV